MLKKFFLLLLLTFVTLCLHAQTTDQRYRQYIQQYKDLAIEQMMKWKIPASITLAQGLLESGAGQSTLAVKGNNHFGIKCHNGWTGPTMLKDDDRKDDCFRVYSSPYESYEDHSKFLASSQRYRSLFSLKTTDYKGWARGLKAAGYATNPVYAQSLIDIIERYGLYQYDNAKSYDKFMYEHSRNEVAGGQPMHPIYAYNNNYYLYAKRGDTFRSLAPEVGVSYRKLARYNELDKNTVLEDGQIVWLEKKKTKAPKEFRKRPHIVQPGESMHSIAQKYGIRLKSLYKKNNLLPDYQIRVGDALRVR